MKGFNTSIFLCFSYALIAQTLVAPSQHEWNAFFYQDTSGTTYLSSLKHWNTYDGNIVEPFGDPLTANAGGYIQSDLFTDKQGKLWYTTEQGIFHLDPERETIIRAKIPDVLKGSFFAFYLDVQRDLLWFADQDGIRSYDVVTGEIESIPSTTNSVRFAAYTFPDGKPQTIAGALYSNGIGFELYSKAHPGAEWEHQQFTSVGEFKLSHVRNLIFTSQNTLALATDDGLFHYDLTTGEILKITSGTVHDLTINSLRTVLSCSVLGKSVNTYSIDSGQLEMRMLEARDDTEALELNYDQDNRLWAHHPGQGVTYQPKTINAFVDNSPELRQYSLVDLHKTNTGELYLLSKNGNIFSLQGIPNRWENIFQSSRSEKFKRLSSDEDFLFLHTPRSILRLKRDADGNLSKPQWSAEKKIFQNIVHLKDKSSFILDFTNIYTFDRDNLNRDTIPSYFKPFPDFSFDYLKGFGGDNFVLALNSQFLLLLENYRGTIKERERIKSPGDIMCVTTTEKDRSLLFGTNVGLYKSVNNEAQLIDIPLPSVGTVKSIFLYMDSLIILGTDDGLVVFNDKQETAEKYRTTEGLPDNNFIADAATKDESGNIWMLTSKGVIQFIPEQIPSIKYEYQPSVAAIWVNNLPHQDSIAPQFLDNLNLSYRENTLNFKISNTGYEEVERSLVSYRLIGYDTTWVNIDNGGHAVFTKVPPGDYILEFKSIDPYGNSSGQKEIKVSISPPFYQTWWFWLLSASSLLALGLYLNRRAVRKETIRQEALREEEARAAAETLARHQAVVSEQRRIMMELHDDLGGTLGNLFYKLDGYLLDQESGLPVTPDLQHLKDTSGDAMRKLREVMKTNVAKALPLPVFARKLTEMARQAALDGNLKWTLERDQAFPELELSSQQVHNALLIVKEGLQNIRKHARAESFVLHLHLKEDTTQFAITLTDDGIGLPEQPAGARQDGTGNGLSNMQRRAADLSGVLTISKPTSGGTSLELRFPVQNQLET